MPRTGVLRIVVQPKLGGPSGTPTGGRSNGPSPSGTTQPAPRVDGTGYSGSGHGRYGVQGRANESSAQGSAPPRNGSGLPNGLLPNGYPNGNSNSKANGTCGTGNGRLGAGGFAVASRQPNGKSDVEAEILAMLDEDEEGPSAGAAAALPTDYAQMCIQALQRNFLKVREQKGEGWGGMAGLSVCAVGEGGGRCCHYLGWHEWAYCIASGRVVLNPPS